MAAESLLSFAQHPYAAFIPPGTVTVCESSTIEPVMQPDKPFPFKT